MTIERPIRDGLLGRGSTYWRNAYRDHSRRREVLYDALWELVTDLDTNEDETESLNRAREVIQSEQDIGGGPSVCRVCGGTGLRHNREEEGDYDES